jgi:hypothetical protein
MFFLFVLLLVPLVANADGCLDYTTTEQCMNASSCYPTNGGCRECPPGSYCPGQNDPHCSDWDENFGLCECPAPFTATIGDGKTSINDCLIKITECEGNNVTQLSQPLYLGCHIWSGEACDPDNATFYNIQRNPELTTSPRIAYKWLEEKLSLYYEGGLENGDLETSLGNLSGAGIPDGYHLESKPIYEITRAENEPISPVSFEVICVQNTRPCGQFTTDYDPNDPNAIGAPIGDDLDNLTGTHCSPDNSNIQGNAFWQPVDESYTYTNGEWNIQNCRCVNPNPSDLIPDDDKNCLVYGGTQKPLTTCEQCTIHTVYENVIYDTQALSTEESNCVKCKSGDYYVADTDFNNGVVERCTQIPDSQKRGWFRIPLSNGYCDGSAIWSGALTRNPCPLVADCAVGQTTNTDYCIKEGEENCCTFGNSTQICDSNGCQSLGNPSAWQSMLP